MTKLSFILTPERCRCKAPGSSQRKLFELLASCLGEPLEIENDLLVQAFLERERLGSTALGQGIAIPHCRTEHTDKILGALISLEHAINFDTPDDRQVDLFFALIVPSEAHEEHLQLLSQLANGFQNQDFCDKLRQCDNDHDLYQTYINYQNKLES